MSRDPLRVPLEAIAPGARALPEEAASYVARVHRLREGDRFVVFDPDLAIEADATVGAVGRRAVEVFIEPPRPASFRPTRCVVWVQAVGKGDKMDAVVRDATELGATRFVPAIAARSVARPAADRSARWRRVAVEAARQCGRGDAPRIDPPTELAAAAAALAPLGPAAACLDPRGDTPLGAHLRALPAGAEVAFVAGPEGGLSPEEIAACEAAGMRRVRLGPLTLRTETVCAATLGALLALGA